MRDFFSGLHFKLFFYSLAILCAESCTSHRQQELFHKIPSSSSGITFINKLTYADSLSVLEFEYMFNGAGVALLDVNNDGLEDIFFTGNMVSCRLYLNKGDLKFEDITEKAGLQTAGWAYGASVVDINQDGYADIYVCIAGSRKTPKDKMHNLFFLNNKDNTFTQKAAEMGLDDDGYDIQAAFLDYDKDGDPDMYLLRNAFVSYNRNTVRLKEVDGAAASADKLFRNNGNFTFTDVSGQAGITIEGFGLGVSVCDLNDDTWPDLYVSNDFLTNDLVWVNNGNGTFSNKAGSYLRHQTYNGMGNDVADFNNDGKEDIMVVDMLPPDNKRWKLTMRGNTYDEFQNALSYGYEPQYVRNTLQLNNGDGTFSEIGQLAGVQATEWSWAPLFADFDNDGYKDLFISNGYRQDITNLDFIVYGKRALFVGTAEANRKERLDQLKKYPGIQVPDYLLKNNGDLTFKKMIHSGFKEASYSNGAGYGDLDNDGDLDLVINNLDQEASVYENQTDKINKDQKWLRLKFKGPPGNRDGLGTKVYIWEDSHMQYQYFSPYRGYLSTVEPFLHFGCKSKAVDSVKIVWPDGKEQLINNPPVNKFLTADYKNAQTRNDRPAATNSQMFLEYGKEAAIHYKHMEDEFVDFKMQPLLPHMLSHEGPGISVGDVNGDRLEDFFIGGGAGSSGQLFMQQKNGKFLSAAVATNSLADNMGSLLFDAEGDGDQDLFVVNGGVSAKKNGDSIYQPTLYVNDGKGGFTPSKNSLPPMNTSGSVVIAADYDHDGDLDLFVAGRLSPGDYPMSPKSFLLRNDSEKGQCLFADVTKSAGIDPSGAGMITSALWTDYNNDGWQDLILAGEFMPITFFKNEKGKNFSYTFIIPHSYGWWNSIVAEDFDKDGDIDYVAGNRGLNGPYTASVQQPVCIYAKDFDKNGRLDPIMCHYLDGQEYVVHARDDINKQITPMRGRFRDYDAYASVTFEEAFTADETKDAFVVRCETFSSAYIENLGNDKFALNNLPTEAQFAPVYGMLTKDFNGDGNTDVLCVGNSFATEVQTGRYDAQGSFILVGNGKGDFTVDRTALNVIGDHKAVAELTSEKGSLVLISSNSDSLHIYRLNRPGQRVVEIAADETYALLTYQNGATCRREFYYGSTYLSQSTRRLTVTAGIRSATIFNFEGKKRTLRF